MLVTVGVVVPETIHGLAGSVPGVSDSKSYTTSAYELIASSDEASNAIK